MKVLHVINNLGAGGAEKLIEEITPIMNSIQGVQVEVLLLTDKNNVFDKNLKDKDVKVEVIPIRNIRSIKNIYYIRKYLIKGKYDIVHAHLFTSNYWVSLASKFMFKYRPKLVITEHNTHNRRREKLFLKYPEKYIYKSYDKIISISGKTQENLIRWLNPKNSDEHKFMTIPNGINVSRFTNAKPYKKEEVNDSFTDKTKLLCMAGSFSKQKDQATIVRAMKMLPNDIHLLLVGEGELKQKNYKLARELNLENRIHFLGFRNDIEKIFKTSDIIILSSHWEGFGLVAAEGMAAGKPVIASDVDGLREVVKNLGILFPSGDDKELSTIIKRLLTNEEEYKKVSKACLKGSSKFDVNEMAMNYVREYSNLLKV